MEEAESSDGVLTKDELILLTAVCNNAPMDVVARSISASNINVCNKNGKTALHGAVRNERWELVPVLLQHGADVNLATDCQETPLYVAVWYDAPADIVAQLISPYNINMKNVDGDTVLHVALKFQKWELVPVLLQHGADVNLCDSWLQETPLHLAVSTQAPTDIITRLISPQSINNQNEEDGDSALHAVVRDERWELLPVLLQHGADVNIGNKSKDTPLWLAAHHGAPADIITQLISPHNINMQDVEGETALHEAVNEKRWELVPVLLQHGADPFICGILPEPPLPLSLQSLSIATIRSHMSVKSDEAYEALGLPPVLPALKLKPLADEIVAIKQQEDLT